MSVHVALHNSQVNRHSKIDETPTGITLALGVATLIVAALIAAMVPQSHPAWRFGIVVATVGLFAAIALDGRALLGMTLFAFGVENGFLEDRAGHLAWHGASDLWRVIALVAVAAGGLAAGEAYRLLHDRARHRFSEHRFSEHRFSEHRFDEPELDDHRLNKEEHGG